MEVKSLFLKFFCYVIWFDETRHGRPCKRGLHIKSYFFSSKKLYLYFLVIRIDIGKMYFQPFLFRNSKALQKQKIDSSKIPLLTNRNYFSLFLSIWKNTFETP